jgi:hypothetical protein
MIDTSRLASRRVAVLGVAVVIMLVGAFLVVRVTSGPAYEAVAQITLGIPPDGPGIQTGELRPPSAAFVAALNQEVGEFLESPVVMERAETLLSEAGVSFDVDASFVEKNLRTDVRAIDARLGLVEVKFRADDPDVARQGANAIVEAYRQLRSGGEFDGDWEITSRSLAPVPSGRIDTLDSVAVSVFVLLSILAVYLTWKWWPDTHRALGRREHVQSVMLAVRVLLSVAAGIVTFLGAMTGTCDDVGGVPTWDRCTSWLGTPLLFEFEWPSGIGGLIFPLILGSGAGALLWWLSGSVRGKSPQ